MGIIIPAYSERLMLSAIVGAAPREALSLRLYMNDKRQELGDVRSSYVEAAFSGYVPRLLDAARWEYGPGSPAKATHPLVTFTSDMNQVPQLVFGYLIVGEDTGALWWAERFSDGPYPVANVGDQVRVRPSLRLASPERT